MKVAEKRYGIKGNGRVGRSKHYMLSLADPLNYTSGIPDQF
jgi:hypothetical protein